MLRASRRAWPGLVNGMGEDDLVICRGTNSGIQLTPLKISCAIEASFSYCSRFYVVLQSSSRQRIYFLVFFIIQFQIQNPQNPHLTSPSSTPPPKISNFPDSLARNPHLCFDFCFVPTPPPSAAIREFSPPPPPNPITGSARQRVKPEVLDALSSAEKQVGDYHSKLEVLNDKYSQSEAVKKKFRDQFLYAEQELAAAKGREKALQEQLLKGVGDHQEQLKKQIQSYSELEVERMECKASSIELLKEKLLEEKGRRELQELSSLKLMIEDIPDMSCCDDKIPVC